MHHLRGNAIPAGSLSDSDEILCYCGIPRSVLLRGVYSDTTQLDVELSSVELCRYKRAFKQDFNIVGIDMSAEIDQNRENFEFLLKIYP